MQNFFFLLKHIDEIDIKKNNTNLMSYITSYRQILDIVNKNDKDMLEIFIKSICKNNEFIDLCSKVNVYDRSKRTIFNYIASNFGKSKIF